MIFLSLPPTVYSVCPRKHSKPTPRISEASLRCLLRQWSYFRILKGGVNQVPVYRCRGVAPSWCPIPPSTPIPSRVPTVGPCVPGRAPAAAGRPPAERHSPVPPRQPPLQGPPRSVRRGGGGGGGRDTPYLLRISKKIRKIPNPPKIAKSKTQRHSWVGVDFGRRGNRSEHATRTRRPSVVFRAVCPPPPALCTSAPSGGPATSP